MRYAVVIENAGSNFSAYVPDLPGCVPTGATLRSRRGDPRGHRVPSRMGCARTVHPFRLHRAKSSTSKLGLSESIDGARDKSSPKPILRRARRSALQPLGIGQGIAVAERSSMLRGQIAEAERIAFESEPHVRATSESLCFPSQRQEEFAHDYADTLEFVEAQQP